MPNLFLVTWASGDFRDSTESLGLLGERELVLAKLVAWEKGLAKLDVVDLREEPAPRIYLVLPDGSFGEAQTWKQFRG